MKTDPIHGQTIRFTFTDGPMAKKTFEHVFDSKGTLTFRRLGGAASSNGTTNDEGKKAPEPTYEVAMIRDDLGAVSYVGSGGYTLTTVLDFKTKRLVAFSSNEKEVSVQHGTFAYADEATPVPSTERAHG
jgi:hypothetical protein